jgi:hypothetical protein
MKLTMLRPPPRRAAVTLRKVAVPLRRMAMTSRKEAVASGKEVTMTLKRGGDLEEKEVTSSQKILDMDQVKDLVFLSILWMTI